MIKYLLILLLPLTVYASKILSYNIYDRTDRVDVMITFDTPYEGIIKQHRSSSKILIKLQDSEIESSKVKSLSTKFLQSISITPMAGYTQIVADVPSTVRLIASKTSDAYGLRLRFTNQKASKTTQEESSTQESLSHLPTKKDSGMSQSYYIVITILIIGIIILFILKRKIDKQTDSVQNNSKWLFKSNPTDNANIPQKQSTHENKNNISIRFQKDINSQNSVIMLDFDEQSYLILMGKTNILLDKFTDDKPTTQEDFDSILQSRHQELDEFLRVDDTTYVEEEKEPLQVYKEKAASIIYEEDSQNINRS